jgi:hypothetical protein
MAILVTETKVFYQWSAEAENNREIGRAQGSGASTAARLKGFVDGKRNDSEL